MGADTYLGMPAFPSPPLGIMAGIHAAASRRGLISSSRQSSADHHLCLTLEAAKTCPRSHTWPASGTVAATPQPCPIELCPLCFSEPSVQLPLTASSEPGKESPSCRQQTADSDCGERPADLGRVLISEEEKLPGLSSTNNPHKN